MAIKRSIRLECSVCHQMNDNVVLPKDFHNHVEVKEDGTCTKCGFTNNEFYKIISQKLIELRNNNDSIYGSENGNDLLSKNAGIERGFCA